VPQVWEVTNPELAVLRLHGRNADMRLAKALAFLDDSGHPDCLAALPLVPRARQGSSLVAAPPKTLTG